MNVVKIWAIVFFFGDHILANEETPVLITKANKKDLQTCAQILTSPKNSKYACPGLNFWETHTYLKNALPISLYKILVAKKNTSIVGVAICHQTKPTEQSIHALAVHENHYQQGIGSLLLKYAQEEANTKKNLLTLMVKKNNSKAIQLYTKFSFKKVKEFGPYQEYQYRPSES